MTIKMCRNVIRLLEVHIEHTAIAKSRIVHSPREKRSIIDSYLVEKKVCIFIVSFFIVNMIKLY